MKALLTGLACALLVACAGGDDDAPAADPTVAVPASASQSTAGFIDYLRQLVATAPDDKEPVDLAALTPPLADDAEPEAVAP